MGRASKVCPHCPNVQPCPEHTPKPWAGSNRRQRLPRGWERIRAYVLRRDPICKARLVCDGAPSTQVDHVHAGDDHSLGNLQGICDECHAVKSAREGVEARR